MMLGHTSRRVSFDELIQFGFYGMSFVFLLLSTMGCHYNSTKTDQNIYEFCQYKPFS
jgi:hypothetical protein